MWSVGYLLWVEWSLQRDADGITEVSDAEDDEGADLAPGEASDRYHCHTLHAACSRDVTESRGAAPACRRPLLISTYQRPLNLSHSACLADGMSNNVNQLTSSSTGQEFEENFSKCLFRQYNVPGNRYVCTTCMFT